MEMTDYFDKPAKGSTRQRVADHSALDSLNLKHHAKTCTLITIASASSPSIEYLSAESAIAAAPASPRMYGNVRFRVERKESIDPAMRSIQVEA